jgi:hypothetical protein
LFVCINSSTLDSYSVVGKITSDLPLSARVIMVPLSFSLVFMFRTVVASKCALCVSEGLLFSCKVLMCSAVSFLYTSRSEGGRCDMAVSASRAMFRTQF